MSPTDLDPKAIEERAVLKLLEVARELLERADDYTAIMFLDHAIAVLQPGGSPLTIRPL
jgi:hypothetical protein